MRFPRLVHPVLALLLSASLAACAPDAPESVLMYRVTALDGGRPSEQDMHDGRSRLDVRLVGAGYESYDVSIMPQERLRVMLPDQAIPRLPEIRALLEDPDDLPVRLEPLTD